MNLSRHASAPALLAAALWCACPAAAQESFQLSSKYLEIEFVNGNAWDGQHRFGNVFCLSFPRPAEAKSISEAMFNGNTLYFSRALYSDMTGIFVVTSTIPPGRSVEMEIGNIEAHNQKNVDAHPVNFKQSRMTGPLGPSLILTVRNAIAGSKDKPFPFIRSIVKYPDGELRTLSVHRLFVRGSDRIEVAGLRYFAAPIATDDEADNTAALSALVESAADSLQDCTAGLPLRNR